MDQFEKALLCKTFTPLRQELFEKGKKAEVGEVREWKGQKMRKTSNGWVPAGEGKQKSNQEEPSTELKEQPKDLATLARAASDSALKVAAQGPNEEVRIAAKRELERRKSEGSDVFEAPKEEGVLETEEPKGEEPSTETPKKKLSKIRQTSKVKNNKDSISSEYDEDAEGLAGWIDDKYDVDEWDPIFLELRDSGAILEGALDVSSYKNSSETQVVNSIFENYFESYTDLGEQDIKNILHGMVQYYSSESGGKKGSEEEEKPSKSKKSKLDPTSKKGVEGFLKSNFKNSNYTITEDPETGRMVVSGSFKCYGSEIKSLNNNGAFDWGEVTNFNCIDCEFLTSLEGAPKKVGGDFKVWAPSLTSLEGAPKEVGGDFSCVWCGSLTSLEGAPEKVNGKFNCSMCSDLTSLEGAPKEVGSDFDCRDCGKEFSATDVIRKTTVKGNIKVV